jgi:hypothetical protein
MAATVDYRRAAASASASAGSGTFFTPLGDAATAAVEARFETLAGVALCSPAVTPTTLRVLFDRSLVRFHRVGSHGRWRDTCLQTAHMPI